MHEATRHSNLLLDTMQTAGWIAKIIETDKPDRVHIDTGGLGGGVYDRLAELGFGGFGKGIINAVNFGNKPIIPPELDETGKPSGGPANRRAEMWNNLKKALEAGNFVLPDSDSLQADLCAPGYTYTSDGRLQLESKDQMRKRGMPSPDEGDAVALCFAEPGGASYVRNANFNRRIIYPKHGYV